MSAVICGVDGCDQEVQPLVDSGMYPKCEECGQPACDSHMHNFGGRLVCHQCQPADHLTEGVTDIGLDWLGGG